MPLRFAYSTINWGETPDLDPMLAQIHGAGWRAVELFWHDLGWLGPHTRLRRQLDDAGLRPATMFGAVALPVDDRQRHRLQRQIDYAALLGAEAYGLVGAARLRFRPPSPAEEQELAAACDDLAAYAAAQGLALAYHPHTACTVETEPEIDRLLARTSRLRLCLDPSHIALVGEDPVAQLRRYRGRLGYVHLKDWGNGKFVELGRGTLGIDTAAVLAELEAQAFPGWVVVEQSRSDVSPLHSAEINAAFLRDLGYDPGATERAAASP